MSARGVLAGVALAVSLGMACGDDDATELEADAGGAGGASDASNTPPLDAQPTVASLPSYVVPGTEAMTAIAIDRTSGTFFVDSAESGKIYRGEAGAETETQLELWADLSASGITAGGHMALSPDGATLYMASGIGAQPRVRVIDVASRTLATTVELSAGASGFALLQDIAVSPDGTTAYVTDSLENVIRVIDTTTYAASQFALSSEFPFISDESRGFLNATGVSVSNDGAYLLVGHLIDKHVYRVSLAPTDRGRAQIIDTTPYNVSGNGLFLGTDGDLLQVAGDELRVFRFQMNEDYTVGTFQARYQRDELEQGLTYAVAHQQRLLVLNGSGLGPTAPGGGVPPGPVDGGDAGGFPGAPDGAIPGIPAAGGDAGTKKLPIRVLQLPL